MMKHHNPQIDSIYKQGTNGAGVLLIHGFTGTPDSLRPVINTLHHNGYTVSAPLLAGHGTTPEQCAQTSWHDWFYTCQKAYMELQEKCTQIFIGGLSLGSLLTLKLTLEAPHKPTGIACLATPLYLKPWVTKLIPFAASQFVKPFWKYQKKIDVDIKDPVAKKNFWNYRLMPLSCIKSIVDLQKSIRPKLSEITTPTLLIHARHDSTAPYDSMHHVASEISSTTTESVSLENSYHIITLDYEKDLVANTVTHFFNRFLYNGDPIQQG